ncbi:hypothetical protein [Criblamydia sequanensis]|uniref:Uncharacterized protein n=1 Tax=Candidatus Criblamydia sequanensis CRIB-18 TaxID=1437425 RepID=A0A090D2V6_9BACT|nr:hypothetical protein [Criblamydia sequanensis]CDR34678.1 hypothetical protein CSEC_1871 [Criblamydia sequanensis CRIB-18]
MYPYVISQSNTTLRAVDNQYFYVYTPYNQLVDALKANYTIEEIRKGTLDQLDYPE